jgi:hypothetical protein
VSLVTTTIKESSPARGKDDHGVALAGMRAGEDEDDPLLSFFRRRGIFGLALGWCLGRCAGLCCRLLLGWYGPRVILPFFLIFFSVFISPFVYFLF